MPRKSEKSKESPSEKKSGRRKKAEKLIKDAGKIEKPKKKRSAPRKPKKLPKEPSRPKKPQLNTDPTPENLKCQEWIKEQKRLRVKYPKIDVNEDSETESEDDEEVTSEVS